MLLNSTRLSLAERDSLTADDGRFFRMTGSSGVIPQAWLVAIPLKFLFSGKRVNQDLIRREQVSRNSEFGTSGGFEFPDERASVLY